MIALAGRMAVIAAALAGILGAVLAWRGRGSGPSRRWAVRLAFAFFAAMLLANLLLEAALLSHDFSVSYVAQVGSRRAPAWVSAVSLWSSLDGSILFWGLVLGGYLAVFALRRDRGAERTTALAALLGVGAGFALLSALPASPFREIVPIPLDGPGPNSLLQNHPLMAIHPPVLYLGYVGMAVPFALACAALRARRLDRELLISLRGWLVAAWIFLTVGIALGARWAYDVLGWGGYWSWDPVENASLMPWLIATAALHALRRVERRRGSAAFALALVQAAFVLTVLGTFLTRSGIVSSVHSFSPGPVGPSLLVLLAAVLLFSVLVLAWGAAGLDEEPGKSEGWLGRDAGILANNLVLALLTFGILLGTLYPVALRALSGTRASVGEGYYDALAVPLGVALLFLMGVGPSLPWGGVAPRQALRLLLPRLAIGLLAGAVVFLLGARSPGLLCAVAAGGFAIASAVEAAAGPVATALANGQPARVARHLVEGRRRLGGHLAHAGMAVVLVAVAASSSGRQVREVSVRRGETVAIGSYQVRLAGVRYYPESNRDGFVGVFGIERDGALLGALGPRLDRYRGTGETLGSPAVLSTPKEDLYLTLLSLDPAGEEAGVRLQLAPMISWLWIGAAVVALGGVLALPLPRRKRAAIVAPALKEARA